ncbi:MAG TPA: isocitrate lyase/phosphoenolpyruvate mutase family protein [Solirubrobacteraceae bacterium]|nr:isocitrate lyase/phosphoenolpyruvate mutase family protein [Solirubrobacteraceae bacterium]
MSATQADKAEQFLKLHRKGEPLLMPNAWDVGSAGILAWLGFKALATTSSGHAATLGKLDGGVTREEALAHATELSAGTDLPVSADLENAFADEPDGVAETIRGAKATGLAGCSVEDYSGNPETGIYERGLARERVVAAAEIAHSGSVRMVLTARAENLIRGRDDLADTIERLQSYQEAGADVLFAPGLKSAQDIRQVVESVDLPVSVLAVPGTPGTAELAALGVARVSVGGAFAFAALGGLREAAEELRDRGTYGYLERSALGGQAARAAFKRDA